MKLAFEMIGRKVVPGGMEMVLIHEGCDQETRHLVKDTTDLAKPTPIRCSCGYEVDFYCGNPALARRLFELIKLPSPQDRFGFASGPSQN